MLKIERMAMGRKYASAKSASFFNLRPSLTLTLKSIIYKVQP